MTQKQLNKVVERQLGIFIRKQYCYMNAAIHLKTGNIYYVTGCAWNCTNKDDNNIMVIYQNKEGQTFVREINEFSIKFKPKEARCS